MLLSLSFFAKHSTKDGHSNSLLEFDQINTASSVRRDLDSEVSNLPTIDPIDVGKAEAAIHHWLNAERKKSCKELKIYRDSGKVNLATQNISHGQRIGLFEVQFGTEIFFARVTLSTISSGIENSYTVLEMVPSPCDIGLKNQLAVTVSGKNSVILPYS